MEKIKAKNYSDTYLYGKGNYEKFLFKFLMEADRIDKDDESFEDILYDVKRRQVTPSLLNILKSNKVVLMHSNNPMPRAFKVFVAKDIRYDRNTVKVFIDVSGIVSNKDGRYTCDSAYIDILISYLLSAMNSYIYYTDPNRIMTRSTLTTEGNWCFSLIVYYIIDYLRVGSVDNLKDKVMYMSSIYYQTCLLGKDINSSSVSSVARKISGLSDREINMIEIILESDTDPYSDINTFIKALAHVLRSDTLTLDPFIDKWMKLIGVGTQFGTEMYTSFSTIILDAYVGAYINNQKTIEKICGRHMVSFTNAVFEMGKECV